MLRLDVEPALCTAAEIGYGEEHLNAVLCAELVGVVDVEANLIVE
jgi:hypothetical protein